MRVNYTPEQKARSVEVRCVCPMLWTTGEVCRVMFVDGIYLDTKT